MTQHSPQGPGPWPSPGVRVVPGRVPAPALAGCAGLAVIGLLSGLVVGRPDVTAFGAAFGAVALVAVLLAEPPIVEIRVEVDSDRVLEGDSVVVRLLVRGVTQVDRLDIALVLPGGLAVDEGDSPIAIRLDPGEQRIIAFVLRAERWGLHSVGRVVLRARDRTGLVAWEARARDLHPIRVLPSNEALRHLVRPNRTRVHTGNQVARARGAGTEFAEIRPYQPGDSVRSVNWRLTARRGEPWVNDHHPERSTDVVVFLDTFGASSLRDGVRAAAAIAVAHLDERDRVGLIGFGGSLRWLEPGGGRRQEYRLVDTLITSQVFASEAWRSLAVVPRRCLPPNALVMAVSPLEDQRAVTALIDLRARGIDLAILQVVPTISKPSETKTWRTSKRSRPSPLTALARRVLVLEQDAARTRFALLGVPVARWPAGQPLAGPIEEVIAFRRRLRAASA